MVPVLAVRPIQLYPLASTACIAKRSILPENDSPPFTVTVKSKVGRNFTSKRTEPPSGHNSVMGEKNGETWYSTRSNPELKTLLLRLE